MKPTVFYRVFKSSIDEMSYAGAGKLKGPEITRVKPQRCLQALERGNRWARVKMKKTMQYPTPSEAWVEHQRSFHEAHGSIDVLAKIPTHKGSIGNHAR